ncbi:bacterio-opsin activator domain-containing protein [Halomicrobium salinisoli]|uniref:helix-turn-helix domain-containing protein n=1 Tax=Halomicrobium salinisoli TaxID=2878391 RepID=UPI001CF0CE7B|nr:bacterio-opsin activator domain-containing protein [Halomicrobium salinisoli]
MGVDASRAHTPATRVEFSFAASRDDLPFVELAVAESCSVRLEELVPRGDDRYAEFFSVRGADPDRVLARIEPVDGLDAELIAGSADGGLFEFLLTGRDCPVVTLAEAGALPRGARSVDGGARIVAEVPGSGDVGAVVDAFADDYPSAELVTKCEGTEPTTIFGERDLLAALDRRLTDRQREAIAAAYEAGYYEWPREATAEEVAADLGVAGATFHKHLRAAERKLVATLAEYAGD